MAFHYRKICCSTECAKIYLARVLESRKNKQDTQVLDITDENISITESDTDIAEGDIQENNIEKPKRKYTKKIKEESENSEKIV